MAHYPPEYVMFFYGIEHNVLLFCELTRPPIDAEFIEIYAQMRRRPDGKSLGPLHDVIWQSAAVALGLRPWSEAGRCLKGVDVLSFLGVSEAEYPQRDRVTS
jgi:hypothetical protein